MRAEGCFMAFSIRMKKCRAANAARRRVIPTGLKEMLSYEIIEIA